MVRGNADHHQNYFVSLPTQSDVALYKMKHTLKPDYDKNEMIAAPGVCGCSQVRCPVGSSGYVGIFPTERQDTFLL